MKCKICKKEADPLFNALVLGKYDVKYYSCIHCGFVFTEEPYWLNEAYKNAINLNDTGLMQRNLHFSRVLSTVLYFLFDAKAKYLDYAGGYGIFTRLMRDNGFDFYWSDPYCENILVKGFECENANTKSFLLLSAFEVFGRAVGAGRHFCFTGSFFCNFIRDSFPRPEAGAFSDAPPGSKAATGI